MRRGMRPATAPEDGETEWESRRASSSASSLHRGESSMGYSRPGSHAGPGACDGERNVAVSGAAFDAGGSATEWATATDATTTSEPFGSGSGWRWGTSGTWSPKAAPMVADNRSVSFQSHVRVQSSNFDGETPSGSLGQGLIGLRRSSLADRIYPAPGSGQGLDYGGEGEGDNDDGGDIEFEAAIDFDPVRERAVTRHGLQLQPPPEMDKIDGFLDLLAYTHTGWAFGLLVAVGSQGLVQVSGQDWNGACPLSRTAAFERCCQTPWQNVILESPVLERGSTSSSSSSNAESWSRAMRASRSEDSPLSRPPLVRQTGPPIPTKDAPFHLTSVFRAICLSPSPDRQPVPVGMLFAFEQRPAGPRCGADFSRIVDSMAQTVRTGLERNANVMRREKELLAQSSLISMKRFVSGELPQSSIGKETGSLGMGIFSQAAMSIRAILKAHSCVIWDISCFRLFATDGSGGSQSSDPINEADAAAAGGQSAPQAETWDTWNVRTSLHEPDSGAAELGMPATMASASAHVDPAQADGSALALPAEDVVVATTVAEAASPSIAARASMGEATAGESEDSANSDGWTCSFPVTSQPIGVIGSSGGAMHHYEDLDGTFSRPLIAEFLATTKELGLSSRPQAEGEHIKSAESTIFGEASSLSNLVPNGCQGLIAVPVFETDNQPAFMIFVAFDEPPVLEAADRHYVEQVGSLLLTWSIRSRVARVDRAQTHFISRIQHELRTPLHAVIGTLDILKESLAERCLAPEAADQQELAALVESAATSADALNNMINNVLDFGALKAMPVQPKKADDLPCFRWNDISAAISDTCKSEWISALQRGELGMPEAGATQETPELLLDLDSSDLTGDLIATIDLEALQTVLRKLVNNAIRATSAGFVTVGLKISSREAICERKIRPGSKPRPKDRTYDIEVTVEDTGKGMQREFIESHLFAPYAKEDTFLPGSGLSLAIASRLVHRMGGHITVVSSPLGTKFSITLPVRFGRTKRAPCPAQSAALQHRVAAHFVGFDTPGLAKTKAIIARRHKLDEVERLADARILFATAESMSECDEALSQVAAAASRKCPSQLVVLERIDTKSGDGRRARVEQSELDALLRRHGLANDVQARKVPRPVGYKASSIIDTVKERVLFPHRDARGSKSTRSTSSEPSAASRFSNTQRSSEAPSLPTPTNLDAKAANPLGIARGNPDGSGAGLDSDGVEGNCKAMVAPQHQINDVDVNPSPCTDVRAAAAEYAVEPATLQEVRVAADALGGDPTSHDFVVMVVEDNPLNMRIMTTMLDRAGIRYVQAWNGREAVDLFREHLPHVVLLDITMPIMDGFQACAEIRKLRPAHLVRDDGSPRHRIIAVTALSSEADRLRGREAGMDDWLKKPLKMSSLMSDLKAWKAQVSPV
ncbi:uncharacterized protein PFL1_02660 [Pseudozyma flocculosa PF-1]|uniref:histidine kinase n=1 Tax=Pseudozyma flocculosa PF-1 TaxID=1277687 RepID=A0A061HAQ6_9BASI|nr:uncharacterized protein PFL1_02660 [Pseudozyma flocculosa PF-1]EPQ29987.1 hypothetical protein PFL1_02660 [Pseudozyma flocculosa PF-1]